jgi:hypothetical protein
MAAKKQRKPYVAPKLTPISREEAERRAGGLWPPPGRPVSNIRVTVVSVEGEVNESTGAALGELLKRLLSQ